jgi:DNA-binding beta-propeller fold protein YncE
VRSRNLYSLISLTLLLGSRVTLLVGQTTQQAATFGQIINLGYTPSDIVLDQSRSALYLVNTNSNRIDVVSTSTQLDALRH